MAFEYGQEENKGRDLSILARKWELSGKLEKGGQVVVTRGTGGERGLDVFVLRGFDIASGEAIVQKEVPGGKEEKRFDRVHLQGMNNPIRSGKEWFSLYWKTTGSNLVNDPSRITDDLMTSEDFSQLVANIDFQNKEIWQRVMSQFQKNLEQISEDVSGLRQKIRTLIGEPLGQHELRRSKDGRFGRRTIVAGTEPVLLFQGRTFGDVEMAANESRDDENLWRAYLQVELDDIPRMVEILKEMGNDMAIRGESLDFKFLYATSADLTKGVTPGEFPGLKEGDPRIAVYFKNKDKRQAFIRELKEKYYQDMVDMARKREGKARRPGASVTYDTRTGKEFRHIEVLDQPGHSSEVAADPNWRKKVHGMVTYRP